MNNGILKPFLLAIALALPLAACQRTAKPPPLEGATIGGPFTLTDQDGKRVSDTAFIGRYRLIYFGYTFCPDVCPTSLQHLAKGLKAFEADDPKRGAQVQPILISIDPARDTPAVLKPYVQAFHPRLIGLTGSEAEIADVAKRYAVYFKKQQAEGSSGYLMDHMSQAMLFGPKGEPLALIPQDEGAEAVEKALDRWVR